MENKEYKSLEKAGKDLPFTVPENYFEQFATQMESQVTGKVISVRGMVRSWMYMAAMFVGIVFIGHFFFKVYQNTMEKNEIYDQYLLSQIDDITLLDSYLEEFDYQ